MLIDSNILIYSLDIASPKIKTAQDFLLNQKGVVISQQNIFETIRIITHSRFPSPFNSERAVKALQKIIQGLRVITSKSETTAIALELIKKYRVSGTEIFDAYLVATALTNGIKEIATDNIKHLGKYNEIRVINPFMVD